MLCDYENNNKKLAVARARIELRNNDQRCKYLSGKAQKVMQGFLREKKVVQ